MVSPRLISGLIWSSRVWKSPVWSRMLPSVVLVFASLSSPVSFSVSPLFSVLILFSLSALFFIFPLFLDGFDQWIVILGLIRALFNTLQLDLLSKCKKVINVFLENICFSMVDEIKYCHHIL